MTEFGQSLVQIRKAKQICRVCRVQRACLTWALQHAMSEGIWGGSTETERRSIVADLNGRRAFLGRASPGPSRTGGPRAWPGPNAGSRSLAGPPRSAGYGG